MVECKKMSQLEKANDENEDHRRGIGFSRQRFKLSPKARSS